MTKVFLGEMNLEEVENYMKINFHTKSIFRVKISGNALSAPMAESVLFSYRNECFLGGIPGIW